MRMGRPRKYRRVAFLPTANYFKPIGIPLRSLEEVCLSLEEAEAIRLKDLEGMEQEEGAERMSISRPTFQRILALARQKIADALLNGKAIRIQGGSFELAYRQFRCLNGHQWVVPFEVMISSPPQFCPTCSTAGIEPLLPERFGWSGRGWGRHGRRYMR